MDTSQSSPTPTTTTTTTTASPPSVINRRHIHHLPKSYYIYEWLDYSIYACLVGALLGASKGIRAVRNIHIPKEKMEALRANLYKKPSLSETATTSFEKNATKSNSTTTTTRPLERKHIITASALQNGVRYAINASLFVSTFCAIDGMLRSYGLFNKNDQSSQSSSSSMLKKVNDPLNRLLIPDEIFNRMTSTATSTTTSDENDHGVSKSDDGHGEVKLDEKIFYTHNIVHKMIAGTVSGTVLGSLASMALSGPSAMIGMITYGALIGLGIGTVASPILIPLQNIFTLSQLQRFTRQQTVVIEREEEKEAIEKGVLEHQMRDLITDESIFLNELDRVKNKLDRVIAEAEVELKKQQQQQDGEK